MKYLLIISISSLLLFTCKENPLETEPNYPPGRRDYTWTADTIKSHVYFNKFVGEYVDDIWAVNMDGSGNDCIYRYDGCKWSPLSLNLNESIYQLVSAYKYGSKVWFTSHDGDIWKYENGTIKKEAKFEYENDNMLLFDITGKSDREIYAFGGRSIGFNKDGCILYYDGVSWIQKELLKDMGKFIKVGYSQKQGKYFVWAYYDNEYKDDVDLIYEYKEQVLIKKDAFNDLSSMNIIDGYLFITRKKSVYRNVNSNWELLFTSSDEKFGGRIYGRNKNDLLVRMTNGIQHWNGVDLQSILRLSSNIEIRGAMLIIENDVFIDAYDYKTNNTIIYHGKLK